MKILNLFFITIEYYIMGCEYYVSINLQIICKDDIIVPIYIELERKLCYYHYEMNEKMFVKVFYTLLTEYNSDTQLPSQHPAWLRVEKLIGQSFDLSLRQALRAEVVKLNQIDSETGAALQEFSDQALIATANMKKFRSDFSASIIKTNELLTMVSGYSLNEQQLATNQEDLYFDAKIGEKA